MYAKLIKNEKCILQPVFALLCIALFCLWSLSANAQTSTRIKPQTIEDAISLAEMLEAENFLNSNTTEPKVLEETPLSNEVILRS